jgi:hypothetical protein
MFDYLIEGHKAEREFKGTSRQSSGVRSYMRT